MTIKDLSKYHDIDLEIRQLKDNIRDLEANIIGASTISDMPKKTGYNDSPTERIGIKLAKLKTKLVNKQNALLDEYHKIEDFLSSVDDAEIRIIIRERFLYGTTWNGVSEKLNMDRSTPYYKLKNYLKGSEDNEIDKKTISKI